MLKAWNSSKISGARLLGPKLSRGQFAILGGLFFTLAQLSFSLGISVVHHGWNVKSYTQLNQWDSFHYLDILSHGYNLPSGTAALKADDVHSNRANLGFFPAYPLISRWIKETFQLSPEAAQLGVAQVASFIFWCEFFILLLRWEVSRRKVLYLGFAVFVYPASFFLVMGYSESIFIAALLGLFLFLDLKSFGFLSESKSSSVVKTPMARNLKFQMISSAMAAFSGGILSATRLVGLPLAVLPFFTPQAFKGSWASRLGQFAIALLGLSGGLMFFWWCQLHFGHWDIYLKLQQLGWGNKPDYWAILYPTSYLPKFFFEDTRNTICRLSNLGILILFSSLLNKEIRTGFTGISHRISYYYAAFAMFFISVSAKASYEMDSMVRYNLPVFVILLLVSTRWPSLEQDGEKGLRANTKGSGYLYLRLFGTLGWVLCALIQIWMIFLFTKGAWVA